MPLLFYRRAFLFIVGVELNLKKLELHNFIVNQTLSFNTPLKAFTIFFDLQQVSNSSPKKYFKLYFPFNSSKHWLIKRLTSKTPSNCPPLCIHIISQIQKSATFPKLDLSLHQRPCNIYRSQSTWLHPQKPIHQLIINRTPTIHSLHKTLAYI